MYHTTLLVNLGILEQKPVGPVMKDEQAGILYAFTCCGHLRYIVDGFIHIGACIKVLAKLDTNAFKPRNDFVSGEILGAVKTHVLKEVSKTTLIIFFKD